MDMPCIKDLEILNAIENFELMLTQLLKRIEKRVKSENDSTSS